MEDSVIIASNAEYIGEVVEKSIRLVTPHCVIKTVGNEADLHRLIDSVHPGYIFLENNFCEIATAYVMAQQLSDNTGVHFVVFSFEPLSVMDMGRFYDLGAVGFLDYRSGKVECLNGISEVFKSNYYITEETKRNMGDGHGAGITQIDFTIRELQVLVLTGKGRSLKAIAEELSLAMRYVSNVKTQIFLKTGLRTSLEILLFAINRGYVTVDQCGGKEWI